ADVAFYLDPSHKWLANAKLAPGDENEGEFHEYYVTAEIFEKVSKRIASKNTNVPNPDYKKEPEAKKQTPAEQKGPSKKETKKIAPSDKKVQDYHEQKIVVKNEISKNPVWEKINSLMMVDVGDSIWSQKKEACVCKEYDLIWGNKVTCEFRKKVIEICKDLWKDNYLEMANNLMAVFYWETGGTFKPDVPNRSKSGATGLIQFIPERADEYFGKHTIEIVPNYFDSKEKDLHNLPRVTQFAKMSALEQLDYVKKYFEPQKNKKIKFVDFYLQVLFPVSSGKDEHVVFADKESKLDLPSENKKIKEKRIAKYSKNDGFDLNKDGKIYKSDIEKKVEIYRTKGLAYKSILECKKIKESNMIFSGDCTIGDVVDGFIVNDKIVKNKIDSCNKSSMSEQVKIIVLHRTAGGKASGTLNWMESQGYGAHFVNDYDGTIYQAIGLDKKASHMGVNRKKSTLENGWGNGNSIGIETCGLSLDKDGISTLISKKTHDHWEPVTDKQAQSIACLLKFLLNYFNLSVEDIKIHEDLCLKTELEGKLVYDAMLPYLE
ncbi:N-acetylmuramoyl-L-alanine amidase, partial [Flavobacterium johnsoniae]